MKRHRSIPFILLPVLWWCAVPAWAAPDVQVKSLEWEGRLQAGEPVVARVWLLNRGAAPVTGLSCIVHSGERIWGELKGLQVLHPGEEIQLQGRVIPPVEGFVMVTATARFPSEAEDANPSDNRLSREVEVARTVRPDLEVARLSAPEELFVGRRARVVVSVRNVGRAPTGGSSLHLLADGEEVARHRLDQRLYPGGSADYILDWTPRREGVVRLAAEVDPLRALHELDRHNNRAEMAVQVAPARRPDLRIVGVSFQGEARAGLPAPTYIQVANEGDAPAYRIHLRATVGKKQVANRTVRGIFPPGRVESVRLSWIPLQTGEQTLVVVVDAEGRMAERAEQNHRAEFPIAVLPPPAPDLEVVRLEAPDRLVVGEESWAEVVVRNRGELLALAMNLVLSADGVRVGSAQSVVPLEPGDERSLTVRWTPVQDGRVTLAAEVETRGARERDLRDNRVEKVVQVEMPFNPAGRSRP